MAARKKKQSKKFVDLRTVSSVDELIAVSPSNKDEISFASNVVTKPRVRGVAMNTDELFSTGSKNKDDIQYASP